MGNRTNDHGFYYSSYHLARDVVNNLAPFLTTLIIVSWIFSDERGMWLLSQFIQATRDSWLLGFVLLVVLASAGFLVGESLDRAIIVLDEWLSRKTSYQGYKKLYKEHSEQIGALYTRFIKVPPLWKTPDTNEDVSRQHKEENQKKDSLTESEERYMIHSLFYYMRHYNPEGYASVYRFWAKEGLLGQVAAYALIILIAATLKIGLNIADAHSTASSTIVILPASLTISVASIYLRYRLKMFTLRHEYAFLVSSAQLMLDQSDASKTKDEESA